MRLADMTWEEAREYCLENKNLIIPVGTCEQHGGHLPLGNDVLVAEWLADALSRQTGALVAPTVSYGVNLPLDQTMTGTAGVTPELLRGALAAMIQWWRGQGFQCFFLLTFHGDPFHLEALGGVAADAVLLEPFEIPYGDVLEKQSTMRHACEGETSIALYLYPEKVRMDCIREHDVPYPQFEPYLYHRREGQPQGYVGSLGFPSAATAEKGRLLVERMMEKALAEYRRHCIQPGMDDPAQR